MLETRVRDAGGTPRVETAIELAERIKRQQERQASKARFLASEAGVKAANTEVGVLFDELQTLAQHVSASISLSVDRRQTEMLWIYGSGFTLVVDWHLPYINTTRESGLFILYHKGRHGPGMHANVEEPRELSRDTYIFDLGPTDEPVWRLKDARLFSTSQLAECLIKDLLNHIAGRD